LFAAGNENRPLNGILPDGRISHQGFALHPDVIAVGASNSQDKRSSYSNFGPELALCAPSSGNPGRGVVTTDRRGIQGYSSSDYTFTFGGTSSATPLAAGLAALILSVDENLTSAEVKQIMMETADKIDAANGQYVDGHSPLYGHGRINAFAAVQLAQSENGDPEVTVEILSVDLSIVEPNGANPDRGLRAETRFEIAGTEADTLAEAQIAFRNDVQIVNLESGEAKVVASAEGQLQPQQLAYTSQQTFAIPAVGLYELQSIIKLLRPSGTISVLGQGPNLRVVPQE
jgi:subtilisin family serine protease